MTMTREQWLIQAIEELQDSVFAEHGAVIPPVRVSVGFPGGGHKRKAIGECWNPEAANDKISQIFISPVLSDSVRVLDVLAHEIIHAIYPKAGHKGAFKQLATAIGLEGKMTATTAGPELTEKLKIISENLGDYPHAALNLGNRKKQSTRLIKLECVECGYIARTTNKWIEQIGAPICPCSDREMRVN